MKYHRTLYTVLCTLLLTACGGGSSSNSTPPAVSNPSTSGTQTAQEYVAEVLQVMQEHALTRYEVDWGHLEMEVEALAANAQSISDTYPALDKAFELLNTNHSFILKDGFVVSGYSSLDCSESFELQSPDEQPDIGYIRVDSFGDVAETSSQYFAAQIQLEISNQDNAGLHGWIVDLRDNDGGNMYPMIAGLGPLLGEGTHGYFIDADEQRIPWGYEGGASFVGDFQAVTVTEPYEPINQDVKLAILSSNRTASSGEASLIAFKKIANARSFGTDSCGLSTGNSRFPLSDGSELLLTVVTLADREQQKYGAEVPVDESVPQVDVVNRAIEWIRN